MGSSIINSENSRLLKEIKVWFKGPQNYKEGLKLLGRVTKRWKVYSKLLGGESKSHRLRLIHELNYAEKRLKNG